MVMPGDNVSITVKLIAPIAMELEGLRFAIREGGRTVGAGVGVVATIDATEGGSPCKSKDPHPPEGLRLQADRPVGSGNR